MTAFLRFWRSLPVLSAGLVIALELYLVLCGGRSRDYVVGLISGMRTLFGEGITGALLGTILLMAAAGAAELGRALLLPISQVLGNLLRKFDRGSHTRFGRTLRTLAASPVALAVQLFDSHTEWISNFYKSISLSQAQSPELYAMVRDEWEHVFPLIHDIVYRAESMPEEFWRFTYFTNVTQEQAIADYEQVRMEAIQLMWLAIALAPFVVARLVDGGGIILMATIGAGSLAALLIPTYLKRKLTFAVYIVYSFALGAQFGEAAEVTDRAAE
ncbi:MAG TPA: hypothetical protein VF173_06985 [Thermoanaerobaculia bacterium]|nr:hypothetical protein [Thermoanaerobaculia bacterium]